MKQSILVVSVLAVATLGMTTTDVSSTRGAELFTGTQLGTNGKSCSGCHPKGKGLTNAAHYDDAELGPIINQCIRNPLKGKALEPGSAEMKALINYIKSGAPSAPR